jgi:transcriptional regulator with XRE-family HTH domain
LSLPKNLRRLRMTDGHSVEEVARGAGVPPALIQAVENGRREDVPPRVVRALARHFRITEAELLS